MARKVLSDQLGGIRDNIPSSSATPAEALSFDMQPDDTSTLTGIIESLGIVGTGGAVPFETTVTGDGTKQCWPNRQATVSIIARDRDGVQVRVNID